MQLFFRPVQEVEILIEKFIFEGIVWGEAVPDGAELRDSRGQMVRPDLDGDLPCGQRIDLDDGRFDLIVEALVVEVFDDANDLARLQRVGFVAIPGMLGQGLAKGLFRGAIAEFIHRCLVDDPGMILIGTHRTGKIPTRDQP